MKRLTKELFAIVTIVPMVGFSQKTIEIDVKSNVHSISPYIYGTNESYEGATAARWGGNRSTSYNWENNASNGGNDANFTSDNFYDYSGSTVPALPILNATKDADSKGQYNLVSLQAAGYVAADKNGAVSEDQAAPSNRWKAISFHKDGPYTLTPDPNDDVVYIDELVHYLSAKLGRAGDGGVSAYAIDNEPYLWNQTHARLHPQKTTPKELIEKTVELSKVIRREAPGADIYGPMFFGWTDAYHWGMDNQEWKTIYNLSRREGYTNTYAWFVDYYLDTLRKVEEETGIRPIDAIAFHWYPESYGKKTKKRVVDLDNVASPAELIAEDMIEARLQAPRALWDSKYQYYGADGQRSYVDIQGGKAIIQKIKKSVENFYPGTKIAFTEFEYDAEDHWSGGLSLVDVLGVLGREDVYLACKWDVFKTYSISAYNLYLNYDGNGSKFGNTSVYAMQSDTVSLSSFASLDDNKNLHIIIVNKTNTVQKTKINIANGIYEKGVVYGFGQATSDIIQLETISGIENSSFDYDVPTYSAVHIILEAVPQSKLVKAKVVDPNADEIVLSFNGDLSLTSGTAAAQEFTVSVDGEANAVTGVTVDGKSAVLKLSQAISPSNEQILVSYLGTNVIGDYGYPIASFDTVYVFNEQELAPVRAVSGEVDVLGRYIKLLVSKEISSAANDGFSIMQDDEELGVKEIVVSDESANELYIYPLTRLFKYKSTVLKSANNEVVVAKDGTSLSGFTMNLAGGANFAPEIDSMTIFDNYTIYVYFNTNMLPTTDYDKVGFTITDNEGVTMEYTTKYDKSRRRLAIFTEAPMSYEKEYTMSYVDDSQVLTIHNGVLDSFSKVLESSLRDMGAKVVNIPDETLQVEEYWIRVGDPVVEECSDNSELSSGKHLGYIGENDIYTYKINVPKDATYTLYLRYASERDGDLNFVIDGNTYHLTVPATKNFKTWKEVYRAIPLTAGEHDLQLSILNGGFNANYIRFVEEEKYMGGRITKSSVLKKGNTVSVYFSLPLDVLPEIEDVAMMCNESVELPIESISYVYYNMSSVLTFTMDTLIYQGDAISLQFKSKIKTADGGDINDTTIVVKNNSSQVYVPQDPDAIQSVAQSAYTLSPVPAKCGEPITVTSDSENEISYSVIANNGAVVKSGSFVRNVTFVLDHAGVYSIRMSDGTSVDVKKIIIR
ncbi:MAG: carbohydrate-binding protein [Bacteroidales bacterium]|nr:carbohydrate-binding protein [Bacteroidales bacterium]